jgi:hypothetical protein
LALLLVTLHKTKMTQTKILIIDLSKIRRLFIY